MCEHGLHAPDFVQRTRKAVSDEQTGDSTRSAKKAKKVRARVCVCVCMCVLKEGEEWYPAFGSMHLN